MLQCLQNSDFRNTESETRKCRGELKKQKGKYMLNYSKSRERNLRENGGRKNERQITTKTTWTGRGDRYAWHGCFPSLLPARILPRSVEPDQPLAIRLFGAESTKNIRTPANPATFLRPSHPSILLPFLHDSRGFPQRQTFVRSIDRSAMAAMVASTATSFSYHKVSASFPQTIYCSVHAAIVVRGELNHLINATRFSRDSRWSAGRRTGTGTGTGSGRSGRRSTSTRSRSSRSRRRRGASASAASPPYVVSAIPCLCLVLNSEFSYAWVMGALHMHKPDHTTIDTLELNSLVNKNKRGNAYAQCTSLIIKKTFKSLLKFENEKTYLTYLKKNVSGFWKRLLTVEQIFPVKNGVALFQNSVHHNFGCRVTVCSQCINSILNILRSFWRNTDCVSLLVKL